MNTQDELISILKARKNRAVEILDKYGDAWLIVAAGKIDSNVEYFLGTYTHGMVAILLDREQLVVLINRLEESFARDKQHIDQIEKYYSYREFREKLLGLLKKFSGCRILANFSSLEVCPQASQLSHAMYNELTYFAYKYEIDLKPSGRFVYQLRKNKTEEELKALEKSVAETIKIIDDVCNSGIIRSGTSEKEIASELYKLSYLYDGPAFDVIVASGPNTSNPHHVVSNRKLRTNDIFYIDFGIKYLTMSADITRFFYIGTIETRVMNTYNAVYDAQNEAIKHIKAGVKCHEPDSIARKTLEKHGFDPNLFVHSLGHALGVDVHDVGPRLGRNIQDSIEPNTAYTVEPALYFENEFGVRIEDDVIIYKDTTRRISKAPEEPLGL